MPRPRKCRRVCAMPENQGFEPLGKQGECCGNKIVKMSIDEYETIRLIDWEKLTQVQCAEQMGIARTTVTGIYDSARTKLADALIHGKMLKIYETADGEVLNSVVVSTMGSGHGALAGFLQEHGADTLICGGIGAGAQEALKEAGITLYGGVSGSADQAVEDLLNNELSYDENVMCSHHGEDHHHEGNCGEHGCGRH